MLTKHLDREKLGPPQTTHCYDSFTGRSDSRWRFQQEFQSSTTMKSICLSWEMSESVRAMYIIMPHKLVTMVTLHQHKWHIRKWKGVKAEFMSSKSAHPRTHPRTHARTHEHTHPHTLAIAGQSIYIDIYLSIPKQGACLLLWSYFHYDYLKNTKFHTSSCTSYLVTFKSNIAFSPGTPL